MIEPRRSEPLKATLLYQCRVAVGPGPVTFRVADKYRPFLEADLRGEPAHGNMRYDAANSQIGDADGVDAGFGNQQPVIVRDGDNDRQQLPRTAS